MPLPYILANDTLADADEVQANFEYLDDAHTGSIAGAFDVDSATTVGLIFGYQAGRIRQADGTVLAVAAGTIALDPSATNYVEIDGTGTVTNNTTGFTDGSKPIRHLTTDTDSVTDGSGLGTDIRVGFDFGAEGSGSVAWGDVTATPTTLAGYGITDAASDAELADEATARTAADTTLTTAVTDAQSDIDDHMAEVAPHTGHFDIDGSKPLTGDSDAGGFKWTNLGTPSAGTDAVNKDYADAIAGGFAPRLAVRVATTAALPANTRSTNTLTANSNGNINTAGIDGITNLVVGERVLVKNEATGANNGVYEITAIGGAGAPWVLDRATDFDTSGEAVQGAYYPADEGAVNGSTSWYLATSGATLNTTALVFTRDARGTATATTIANVGAGAAIWKILSGTVNYLRSIVAGSSKVTVTQGTDTITLDVVEANLNHANIGGTVPGTKGGTGQTTSTLGDLLIGAAANAWSKLAGNTTTTRKYLTQTGDGSASAVPSWNTIANADLPVMGASGVSHAKGAVPDPGATSGTARSLHEDGVWRISTGGGYRGTSVSAHAIVGTGAIVWNTQTGLAYSAGVRVRVTYASDIDVWMEGVVSSYNISTGVLTVDVDKSSGSGTGLTPWNINVAGEPGATGATGPANTDASTFTTGVVALARGGTNADLSATGGAVNTTGKKVLKQGADNVIGASALIAADLPNTAVTPGSYTSTDLTVDAQGRITAASNGSGGSAANHAADLYLFNNVI